MSTVYTDDYTKTTYRNDSPPALDQTNLNNSENGIKTLSGRVANISSELSTEESRAKGQESVLALEISRGIGLVPKGVWDNSVSYSPRDLVAYGTTSWICTIANKNKIPQDNSQYWQRMFVAEGDFATHTELSVVNAKVDNIASVTDEVLTINYSIDGQVITYVLDGGDANGY